MARSLTDHELDAWLARNGYGHHAGHAAKMIHQEPTGREIYAAHERGGHLTTAGRRALRADQFALPPGPEEKRRGFKGRLPIHDSEHAHAALTRISQMHHLGHLSASQVAAAKRKIHKAWPSIEISHATKTRVDSASVVADLNSLLRDDQITKSAHRKAVAFVRAHAKHYNGVDIRDAVDAALENELPHWGRQSNG